MANFLDEFTGYVSEYWIEVGLFIVAVSMTLEAFIFLFQWLG